MAGKRSGLRRTLPMLLALLVLVPVFSACGQATDTSGLSGTWVLEAAENGSVALPDGTVRDNRLTLRLDPDGSGSLSDEKPSSDGTDGRVHWRYQDGILRLETGSVVLTGSLEGRTLSLRPEDGETVLRFVRSAGDPEEEPAPAAAGEAFLGDWYGWWKIEDSSGSMPVSWYDCCAVLEPGEEGTVVLTLWDEDGSRGEPLSEVSFSAEEDGSLVSLNGYFVFAEIHKGEWVLREPDPAILISEFRHDAGGENFLATVYLRPWGELWNETPEEQRPFYYEDWYLSLQEEGESMPDKIPWRRLESNREKAPDS